MENLNKVVKEIKIVAKPAKRGGKNYFVRVELVNGRSADVWCDKEVVELIQTCTELGVEPFKSFTLERRTSEKTGAEYIAVVLKMFNDDEYFYFLPRATNTIVELLIAKAAHKGGAGRNGNARKERLNYGKHQNSRRVSRHLRKRRGRLARSRYGFKV